MKKTLTFALAGGDIRQAYLGKLLEQDGLRVRTLGLERHGMESGLECEADMRQLFGEADVIVLPMPVLQKRGRLNAPLANAPYRITDILDAIPVGKTVLGGAVAQMVTDMAARRGIVVQDYLLREELAVLNAIPTAEGAIQIAMEELPVTIHALPVLVVGNGRVGSAVAARLAALGAEVTVSARKPEDFAKIDSAGYCKMDTRHMQGKLKPFALIVNTVPSPIFTRTILSDCNEQVLLLDLASGNGGIAPDAAEVRRVIHALSLPGRVAPMSAAKAIRETIYHILKEAGKL